MENWLIVIPARLKSTRLPEKPLQLLGNKPLIVRVYENLKPLEAEGAKIIIATDSEKVVQTCKQFNCPVELTSENHPCGTDRVQEVAVRHPQKDYILNVQGDEPFVAINDLKKLIHALPQSKYRMGTLSFQSTKIEHWNDKNVVKVVCAQDGKALYFSRSPIPAIAHGHKEHFFPFLQHLGIYAYHKNTLNLFCKLPSGELEKRESLEQLRALENNIDILVLRADHFSRGIDTPEDLEAAHAFI